MADLAIIAKLTDNASGPADGIAKSIGGIEKAAGATGGVLGAMGTAGAVATAALVAGATAAGAGFLVLGKNALEAGIQMEQQLADIAAVMNTTTDAVAPLADLISDLGIDPQLKVTAVEAAAAVEMLARNGLSMAEILDGAAKSSILLANATGTDLSNAANIATDAMAIFKIEASDMLEAVNGITSVTTNSKFNINDYAFALGAAGGTASAVGVEFEDLNVSIAAISPLFKSGRTAGTSFKELLNRLAPTTKTATAAMMELGIITEEGGNAFFDAQGNMKSMNDVTVILNKALSGLSEEQRNVALSTIFGTGAMTSAVGLMEAGAVAYTDAATAASELGVSIDDVNEFIEGGITQYEALMLQMRQTDALENAATKMGTLAGVTEILKGIWESLIIQLGQALIPIFRLLADNLQSFATDVMPAVREGMQIFSDIFANFVSQLSNGTPLIIALKGFIVSLGFAFSDGQVNLNNLVNTVHTFLIRVGEVLGPIAQWISENVKLQDILIGLGANIAVFVIPIIIYMIALLTSIVAPILAAIAVAALLRTAWETNFLGIQDIVAGFVEVIQSFFANLDEGMSIMNAFIEAIWDIAPQPVLDALIILRDEIIPGIVLAFQSLVDLDPAGFMEGVGQAFAGLWDIVQPTLEALKTSIQTWFDSVDWVALFSSITTSLTNAFSSLWEFIQPMLQALWESISEWFSSVDWAALGNLVVDSILLAFSTAGTLLGTYLGELITQITTFFQTVDWTQVGITVMTAIGNAIVAAVAILTVAVTAIYTFIRDFILASDWPAIGQGILDALYTALLGFGIGVGVVLDTWYDAFLTWSNSQDWDAIWQVILDSITSALEGFGEFIADLLAPALETIQGWADEALTVFQDWVNQVVEDFTNWGNDSGVLIEDWSGNVIEILTNWITESIQIFSDWVQDSITQIGEMTAAGLDLIVGWVADFLAELFGWSDETKATFEEWVSDVISQITTWVTDTINMFIQWATDVLNLILTWVADALDAFATWATDVISLINEFVNEFIEWFNDLVSEVMGIIESFLTDAIGAFEEGWNTIISAVGEFFSEVVEGFIQLGTDLVAAIATAWLELKLAWDQGALAIISEIPAIILSFVTPFVDALQQFKDIGSNLMSAVAEGISSSAGKLADAAKAAAQSAYQSALDFFGISSPSTLFLGIGTNLGESLAQGLADTVSLISHTMTAVGHGVKTEGVKAFTEALGAVVEVMREGMVYLDELALFDFDMHMWEYQIKIANLTEILSFAVQDMGDLATWMSIDLVESSSDFAKGLGDVVEVMSDGMVFLDKLAEFDFDMKMWEYQIKIQNLATIVGFAIESMAAVSNNVSTLLLPHVTEYSKTLGEVLSVMIDGMEFLDDLNSLNIEKPMEDYAATIDVLVDVVGIVAQQMSEIAQEFEATILEQTSLFSEAAKDTLAVMEPAIDVVLAMTDALSQGIDLSPSEALQNSLNDLAEIIAQIIVSIQEIAVDFEIDGVEAAAAFSDAAKKVLDLIEPAVDALTALNSTIAPVSEVEGQMGLLKDFIKLVVDHISDIAQDFSTEGIEAAALFADSAGKILDLIIPAIDAITALADYAQSQNLEERTQAFIEDLRVVSEMLVESLSAVAADIGGPTLDAAVSFSIDIASIANHTNDAMQSLEEIGNASTPSLDKQIDYLQTEIPLLADTLTETHDTLGNNVVNETKEFLENAIAITDGVLSAFDVLNNFINGNVPGSLQELLDDMIQALKNTIPDAYDAGHDVGVQFALGFAAGITSKTGAIKAAAEAAAAAALAAAEAELGIESPSKVAEIRIGRNFSAGIAKGMLSMVDISRAGGVLADRMVRAVNPLMRTIHGAGSLGQSDNITEVHIHNLSLPGVTDTVSFIDELQGLQVNE